MFIPLLQTVRSSFPEFGVSTHGVQRIKPRFREITFRDHGISPS
ncbi:rCG40368, partial [Rattus norvegicus]